MAIGILQRIRKVYHSLSKGHKRIANLILRDPSRFQEVSCLKIAQLADVSESTVIRFMNTIGYDSFIEFKSALKAETHNTMNEHERIIALSDGKFNNNLINQTLSLDIKNIRYSLADIDDKVMADFVDASIFSKRKFIIGFGNDELLARLLYNNFVTLFDNVYLLLSHDDHFSHLFSLSKSDQVIIFSASDVSKKLQGISRFSFNKNAIISLFANHESSPIAEYAKHLIVAKSSTLSFNESISAAASIINAITLEIVRKDRQRITKRHNQLNVIKTEYGS